MEYAIAKLKTAEIVGMGAKHLAQIDKICAKHLADTNKSTIFALYINGYGERYYIVQALDVRPIAHMVEGAERRIRNSHTRSKTNRKVHTCRRVCSK